MSDNWLFVAVIFVLVVMSIQFIRGKWLRIIAGNASGASGDSKAQRRLGKVMGVACFFVTLVLILFQRGFLSTTVMYIAVVLATLSTLVLLNRPSKKE